MFCDTVLVLKDGRAVAAGRPAEVLTPRLIAEVYEVEATVRFDADSNRPLVVFKPGRVRAERFAHSER
jgi:iron complex transport system ATP-binding protein